MSKQVKNRSLNLRLKVHFGVRLFLMTFGLSFEISFCQRIISIRAKRFYFFIVSAHDF